MRKTNHFFNKLKILGLANDISLCQPQVRLITPLKSWAVSRHAEVKFYDIKSCPISAIQWADCIVIQRHLSLASLKLIHIARLSKKKVIYDLDDYLLKLPTCSSNQSSTLISHKCLLPFVMPQVDCITVSTSRLAKEYQKFERPIEVIENTVELTEMVSLLPDWKPFTATLLIASSDYVSVETMIKAIKKLTKNKRYFIEVFVIGPAGSYFEKTGVNFKGFAVMNYNEFKTFIRSVHNPIGLIPLDLSSFSACKTAIKFFDYTTAGIPVVCSNVPPYSDVIHHCNQALLVDNDENSWYRCIEDLILEPDLRRSLVSSAQLMVKNKYSQTVAQDKYDQIFTKTFKNGFTEFKKARSPTLWNRTTIRFKFCCNHLSNFASYRMLLSALYREGSKGILKRIIG